MIGVGVDFGTSNSAVAVPTDTGMELVPLEPKLTLLADDLAWWTEAAKLQHARRAPPY